MVICLEQGADLHMAQLMPLPLTVSCSNKIQIGFTFLVLAHLSSPGQRAIKRARVCVVQCTCSLVLFIYFASAAVTVDYSHMTVSSSASRSRFSLPSNFVSGHVSTMWFSGDDSCRISTVSHSCGMSQNVKKNPIRYNTQNKFWCWRTGKVADSWCCGVSLGRMRMLRWLLLCWVRRSHLRQPITRQMCWTCLSTPTSQHTASVIRFPMEKWSAVTITT